MFPIPLKVLIKRFDIKGVIKSTYYNFRLFPFKIAVNFPLLVSGNTKMFCKRGSIILNTNNIKSGMIRFGVSHLRHSLPVGCVIVFEGRGKLKVQGEEYHNFAPGTILKIRENGTLSIGNRFSSGYGNKFFINSDSSFGENNLLSWDCQFMDNDSHPIYDNYGNLLNVSKGFHIGDNVWIGSNCTVLKGANIPEGTVIASGSVITKALVKGKAVYHDSKIIKEDVFWENKPLKY